MFESVLCNEFFRLCALPTAGRAEEDEIEHVGRVPLLCNGVQIYRDFRKNNVFLNDKYFFRLQ
jgi:hypothetical protein